MYLGRNIGGLMSELAVSRFDLKYPTADSGSGAVWDPRDLDPYGELERDAADYPAADIYAVGLGRTDRRILGTCGPSRV